MSLAKDNGIRLDTWHDKVDMNITLGDVLIICAHLHLALQVRRDAGQRPTRLPTLIQEIQTALCKSGLCTDDVLERLGKEEMH